MAFNPDAAIDVQTVETVELMPTSMATEEQVRDIKIDLHRRWSRRASRQLGREYALTQTEFQDAYVELLVKLAAYGSSERLTNHPPIAVTFARHDDENGEVNFVYFDWPIDNLRDVCHSAGVATVRRFARAQADLVYDYFLEHQPRPMTQWHRDSGLESEYYAIAFDFSNFVDPEKLTVDQRNKILRSSKWTIKPAALYANLHEEGAGGQA